MNRKQQAYDLFFEGYNCCQAVVGAFGDVTGIEKERALNLSIAFGGGFARTRGLCGAVAAMGIVIGLFRAKTKKDAQDKAMVYKDLQELVELFKEKNGTVICQELLKDVDNIIDGYEPQVRDSTYYATRPCIKFVLDAVEILEYYFAKQSGK